MKKILFLISVLAVLTPVHAQYKLPPAPLQALVDAPRAPSVHISPKRDWAAMVQTPELPSIADVSQLELKLAGARIHPATHASSRFAFGTKLSLTSLATREEVAIHGMPSALRLGELAWSPDQRHIAFTHVSANAVELWLVDVTAKSAKRLLTQPLAAVFDRGYHWLPDSAGLLVNLRPAGTAPLAALVPEGPVMQDATPGAGVRQLRTYQDMLKNEEDARQFEFYATSQLALVDLKGKATLLGAPAMVLGASVAPSGKLVLLQTLHRPFSYLVPYSNFPRRIEVIDLAGKPQYKVADKPLLEGLADGAVAAGRRDVAWRADAPATLVWSEAFKPNQDKVYIQAAPFAEPPKLLAELGARFAGVRWGRGDFALISEHTRKTKQTRVLRVQPEHPEVAPEQLFAFSTEDRYKQPGTPLLMPSATGHARLAFSADGSLLLSGPGASEEGDRPFIDRYQPSDKTSVRLFQSAAPYYEALVAVLNEEGTRLLTTRESPTERANYFVRDLHKPADQQLTALTNFAHPTPQLKDVKKEQIRYKRADGVALTATLMLPPNYAPERDGPLPMLMWAYPREFASEEAASQTIGSPYRFNAISYMGPAAFLAMGYAVLDNPSMPIVGAKGVEPNDSYLPQLIADAQAAVDEVVRRGVADPKRIAIGGHSYGAFMTANLLAHTRLFKAGIARSGAYNRTLTPFGFQSENRNFWKAKEVYRSMSPFDSADQIKDALLMIHGEEDNNSGTFPIQSERMFQAVKGMGGTARLVMLPHEAHAYRARESILHMLAETNDWLEKFVKAAPPK